MVAKNMGLWQITSPSLSAGWLVVSHTPPSRGAQLPDETSLARRRRDGHSNFLIVLGRQLPESRDTTSVMGERGEGASLGEVNAVHARRCKHDLQGKSA